MKKNDNQATKPAVSIVYFSPTGTTETILENIATGMGQENPVKLNLTLPHVRHNFVKKFTKIKRHTDYWIFGMPVYLGNMPGLVKKLLESLDGSSMAAVAVVLYGNRDFGISLKELVRILSSGNFRIIGAGAFIGEHSYSKMFPAAVGRPDDNDLTVSCNFGNNINKKGINGASIPADMIKGKISLMERMTPAKGPETYVDMDKCTHCNTCVELCTMGVLDPVTKGYKDKKGKDLCLGCMSCVKRCPNEARSFRLSNLMKSVINKVLKEAMTSRNEPYILF